MTDKTSSEGTPRSISQTLVDIRNGAIILASLAVALHFTFSPEPQASMVEKPEIAVGNVKAALQANGAEKTPTSEPIHTMPTSDISAALKARADEIKAAKPVVQKAATIQAPQQAAVNATPVALPQAPVAQVAAPTSQVNGQKQPLKLGVRNDGTAMSEVEKADQIKQLLAALPESFTVNWPAENKKVDLYVFSDPTCGYCKKLHQSMPQLNQAGISVHYFMYPRDMPYSTATTLSPTAQNLNNIWCSIDPRAAFDEAFQGYKVRATDCASLPAELNRPASPLLDHYLLGTLFDVRGTPTMVTSTGLKLEGFNTAQDLINRVLAP